MQELNLLPVAPDANALPIELIVDLANDVLPHEVPIPFGKQNASRRPRFRLPVNFALLSIYLGVPSAIDFMDSRGPLPGLTYESFRPTMSLFDYAASSVTLTAAETQVFYVCVCPTRIARPLLTQVAPN
jgi:hypothetical protein